MKIRVGDKRQPLDFSADVSVEEPVSGQSHLDWRG